jgi:hypothetical protein
VIVSDYPRKDRSSAAQRKGRARFKAALANAKSMLADPLKRERYGRLAAERKTPTNALLIANFLNPPTIDRVDLSAYRGRAGSIVRVSDVRPEPMDRRRRVRDGNGDIAPRRHGFRWAVHPYGSVGLQQLWFRISSRRRTARHRFVRVSVPISIWGYSPIGQIGTFKHVALTKLTYFVFAPVAPPSKKSRRIK